MKRTIAVTLSFLIVLSIAACAVFAAEPSDIPAFTPAITLASTATLESSGIPMVAATVEPKPTQIPLTEEDLEIQRSISSGLVPQNLQGDYDRTVTFAQYSEMLTNLITVWDASRLPEWEKIIAAAAASKKEMRREDGILAISHAMVLMGITSPDGHKLAGSNLPQEELDKQLSDLSWNYPFFPDWDTIVYQWCKSNYMWGGVSMCLNIESNVSFKAIYPYDFAAHSMHLQQPLTRRDAVLSVIRLYETDNKVALAAMPQVNAGKAQLLSQNEAAQEILSAADKRRNAILASPTEIVKGTMVQGKTWSGTAYYVSASGKDANDGLSPQTAWATLEKVNNAHLASGDAVLFERGGIWYGRIHGQKGVTYSAYGSGKKPIISGSLPDAGDPNNWKLYYEGAEGQKIWIFGRELSDVGALFFKDGRIGKKLYPGWNKRQYVNDDGTPFDIKSALKEDLDYFSCIDLKHFDPANNLDDNFAGPLYLRCDSGNPAEVSGGIDVALIGTGINCEGSGITIDNLCVTNQSSLAISCGGYQGCTDIMIQNCELAWCGGALSAYNDNGHGIYKSSISGGAIQMSGTNNTARNNYIHDCDNKVFVTVFNKDYRAESGKIENILMEGNLLERNGGALHMANYVGVQHPAYGFRNIRFEDNFVLYTAQGWFTERLRHTMQTDNWCCVGLSDLSETDEVVIDNNDFLLADLAIVFCNESKLPAGLSFSGNTWGQTADDLWLMFDNGQQPPVFAEEGEDAVRNIAGDKTGKVIVIR